MVFFLDFFGLVIFLVIFLDFFALISFLFVSETSADPRSGESIQVGLPSGLRDGEIIMDGMSDSGFLISGFTFDDGLRVMWDGLRLRDGLLLIDGVLEDNLDGEKDTEGEVVGL